MKIKTLEGDNCPLAMLFIAETGMDKNTLIGLKLAMEQTEGCYVFYRIPLGIRSCHLTGEPAKNLQDFVEDAVRSQSQDN